MVHELPTFWPEFQDPTLQFDEYEPSFRGYLDTAEISAGALRRRFGPRPGWNWFSRQTQEVHHHYNYGYNLRYNLYHTREDPPVIGPTWIGNGLNGFWLSRDKKGIPGKANQCGPSSGMRAVVSCECDTRYGSYTVGEIMYCAEDTGTCGTTTAHQAESSGLYDCPRPPEKDRKDPNWKYMEMLKARKDEEAAAQAARRARRAAEF